MLLAIPPPPLQLGTAGTLPAAGVDPRLAGRVAQEYVARVRAELGRQHAAGASGLSVVVTYTDAIDRLLGWLFETARRHFEKRGSWLQLQCAVVAQGGYGRGELNPWSDIDLLFLYPWKVNPFVETVIDVIVPTLWDAGLTVGQALRNVRESIRLAARDMKVKTALLDARFLCGSMAVWTEFEAGMHRDVWGGSLRPFIDEKLEESIQRHRRAGDSVYLLQPNLKEGRGGLRDLHTALWLAKARFRVRTLRQLVTVGVISERESATLDGAVEFLLRVRNAMHFATASHQDQLTYDLQDQLAPMLDFGPDRAGVERFMRRYYAEAALVARMADQIVARCVERPAAYRRGVPLRVVAPGMHVQGGVLGVAGREVFECDPAAVVRVFAEAQRHEVPVAEGTLALVRESVPALGAARDRPEVTTALLQVLRAPERVADALFVMHRLGVLGAVLPEFGRLDGLVTRDPSHIYTIDEHSLMGVREIDRLRAGAFADREPLLTQVVQQLPQPELLVLGMLFHDVGKGQGRDHSTRGARIMQTVGTYLGLNVDETAAAAFLVQHHLLMSHLAQHRDIADDHLVTDFCRTAETLENLQRLFVLTYADMRAVAPNVWNNWRAALVCELYRRAADVFERGTFEPEDRGARVARIRARALATAPPLDLPAVRHHLEHMPDSYLLATPEEMLLPHATLRLQFERREAAGVTPAEATSRTSFGDRQFTEVAVCTRDRPGLFAMLSGVLASHQLNILAARIATSDDGVALDAFRLSHEDGVELDAERWENVEGTLRAVLAGQLDVEALVERAQPPAYLARRRRGPTRVRIDNAVSPAYSIIDVHTTDRVGLLFTITNCLYRHWLVIHVAKIATMVDQVVDVFYVTEHDGRKVTDPARLDELRRALLAALEADGAAPAADGG